MGFDSLVIWFSLLCGVLFLLGKHKEVKLFYVTSSFFTFHVRSSKQIIWLSLRNFIFLDHALFMSNGLWGAQIKTSLHCSIRLFHRASWCALREKTLLVGVRELIRRTIYIFSRFIMCCMWASLCKAGTLGGYLTAAPKKAPEILWKMEKVEVSCGL